MTDERRKSVWIGLFVLGAFGLLATLIIVFGSLPTLFQPRVYYTVRFADAPGVGTGVPVRRSGVRIGEVDSIRLEEDGSVTVRLALSPTYRPRRSEKPTLYTGLIGGDATIDFVPEEEEPGKPAPDRSPVEPGTQIEGIRGANVNALINRASEVVPTTQEVMNDIRKSIQRLEKSAPMIDNALREFADVSKTVREAIPDARRTIDEIRDLARSVKEAVPDLKTIGKDVSRITTEVREAVPEIRETNKTLQRLIRSVDEVVPEAKKLVQSINAVVPDAQQLIKRVSDAVPEVQKTAAEVTEFLKVVRAEIPEIEKTNTSIREFINSLRDAVPDARRVIDESREFVKGLREVIPDVKQAIEDITATARRATRLGEQLSNLVAENREKINLGIDRAIKVIDDVGQTVQRANTLLGDENQRTINEILRSIRDTVNKGPDISRNIDTLVKTANQTVDEVRGTIKELQPALDSVAKAVTPLSDTVQKILNPLVERAPNLARNIDESTERVNAILKDVRTIVRVFGESDGTLNRILTDPRLFNRVDEILFSVQKLTPRLEQIVKDFGILADKLARHPESIGLGGVVRPGDGLKNTPNVPGTIIRP